MAVIVLGISLVTTSSVPRVGAQYPYPDECVSCNAPPNNGSVANAQASSWTAGAIVRVYIGSGFSDQQRQAIQNALYEWNNAGGSGVRFQISSTPVSGQNTYTVNQAIPALGANYAGETGGTTSGGHRLQWRN